MQSYLTLTRRELAGFFVSMKGYVIIAGAVFLMGLSFLVLMINLQDEPTHLPVTELFYMTPFFWLILLLASPVITMRSFAHEKSSGTFETLMTTPVGDLAVVLAKYTAALAFYMVMWLPLMACLFVLRPHISDAASLNAPVIGSTYLGIFLIGSLFMAFGCFASSLTRSQIIAAMVSFAIGVTLFILSFLATPLGAESPWQTELFSYLALFDHMHSFARGVVDTRPVVYYLSLTVLFLFLTVRVVESRRWK